MSNEVRFVRIRGRIVPIRNKKKREAVESAGLLTAGTGVSIGGAIGSGKLIKKARKLRELGRHGAQNLRASDSTRVRLKDFRLKQKGDKVVKMSGKAKDIAKGQIDMFEQLSKKGAKSFEKGKRVKAYRSAFRARKVFKHSNILSSALVGLGVERALSASGIEDKDHLLGDFASEVAGVGSSFLTHSLSTNIENKVGRGIPLRSGLKKDAMKSLNSLKKAGKLFGSAYLKRKFKI